MFSGTRESAFVLAVTSAGISHAVTKACSSGMHDSCGCDRTIYDHERQPNFEWSGCSDNIHFGAAFSRKFLDSREKGRVQRNPKLGLTNLHNNHVGRQVGEVGLIRKQPATTSVISRNMLISLCFYSAFESTF